MKHKENMKSLNFGAATPFLLAIFFMLVVAGNCIRITRTSYKDAVADPSGQEKTHHKEEAKGARLESHPSGSSLPDCSHACGPCMPCRRVMVSFQCSIAESCPIVYKCMCKGKYYHVPSH